MQRSNCNDPKQWNGGNTSQNTGSSGEISDSGNNTNEGKKHVDNKNGDGTSTEEDKNNTTESEKNGETPDVIVFTPPTIDEPKNPPIDEIIREEYLWKFRYNVRIGKPEENEKIFNVIEKNGLNAHYNIYARPAQPTTDCPAGKYDQPITVSLYCTEGTTVRYRMESGELNLGNSALYEQTIRITKNHSTTNVVAATYDSLYIPSVPLSLTYELERKPLIGPTYSHNSGEYTSKINVSLTNPNNEGKIYYTTDGSEPTTTSKEYSGKISISEGTTNINAKVIDAENDISSDVVSCEYTIKQKPQSTKKTDTLEWSGATCPACGSTNTFIDPSTGIHICKNCGQREPIPEDFEEYSSSGEACSECGSFNTEVIYKSGYKYVICHSCDARHKFYIESGRGNL